MRLKLPGECLSTRQAVTRKTPLVIVSYGVRAHPEGVHLGSDQDNQAHAPELAVKAQVIISGHPMLLH